MKTLFVLYVSLVGSEYQYEPLMSFEIMEDCLYAAELASEALPEYHMFCQSTQYITQPDGSVRPLNRDNNDG
jgi:hypothetical protein